MDGSRRIYYPGKKNSCCKELLGNGGTKLDLLDHMKNLWKNVSFQPKDFHLNTEDDTNDATIKDKLEFSLKIVVPTPSEEDKSKYIAI